jgi:hypothetical protein
MTRPEARRAGWRRVLASVALTAIAWPGGVAPSHAASSDVDVRRSLVVTEQPILARFPLQRVLDQLVAQSGVSGLTSRELFQQWWDTQNPRPGLGLGPHCDDRVDAAGQPILNEFPYTCRPAPSEGGEAVNDPFVDPANNPAAYVPIGLFNRFDLAPADGGHCGEHRIVYARRSGMLDGLSRNLIIFEAMLPNPHPNQGLKGCQRIAKFWADLTQQADVGRRADDLDDFYFRGIANIEPVVHVDHFGNNALGAGQIRTNQFLQASPRAWSLREFKLVRSCGGPACLKVVPVTNKENPFGPLFSPTGAHPRTASFQASLVGQVAALAAGTLTDIDAELLDTFNSGQSQASGGTETDYLTHFGSDPSVLQGNLDAALRALNSPLTARDVVARAQALSCAGCHRLSNGVDMGGGLVWPPSLGFTHVTEQETETVDGVVRFRISDALTTVFLPKRKQVLDDFMNDKPPAAKKAQDPIGVRRVH